MLIWKAGSDMPIVLTSDLANEITNQDTNNQPGLNANNTEPEVEEVVVTGDFIRRGDDGNNTISISIGGTKVDGKGGIDRVIFMGQSSEAEISFIDDEFSVTVESHRAVGLIDIERISFDNTNLALDMSGNAGVVAKTLGAVYGKDAITNTEFAGIGLLQLDNGMDFESLMDIALTARLGADYSDAELINLLYSNVVGEAPDQAEFDAYQDLLDSGQMNHAQLGLLAAEHELNAVNVDLVGLAESGLAYDLAL